jgi:ribonuclease BN (tRNA processing enzyme)
MSAIDRSKGDTESIWLKFLGSGSGDFYIARLRDDIFNNRYPTQLFLPQQGCVIDFSSEAVNLLVKYRIPFNTINHIFITHSQLDHFHAPTIVNFALERKKDNQQPVTVWGTDIVRYILEQEILLSNTADSISINTLTPQQEYSLGDLNILPIPANHLNSGYFKKIGEVALNFIISIGSTKILYAVDTGYPEYSTWRIWNSYNYKAVILESTLGDFKEDASLGHLNFAQAIEIIKRLKANRKIRKDGVTILAHLNSLNILEEEKTKTDLESMGISLAYDGMSILL